MARQFFRDIIANRLRRGVFTSVRELVAAFINTPTQHGLRERGLIDGQADEADRRNIRLQLTNPGRSAQKALRRQSLRVSERAVASLGSDDRRLLMAMLRKVDSCLNEPD